MPTTNEWPDRLSELPEDVHIVRRYAKMIDCSECENAHNPVQAQDFESGTVRLYCPECESRVPQKHLKEDPDGSEISAAK